MPGLSPASPEDPDPPTGGSSPLPPGPPTTEQASSGQPPLAHLVRLWLRLAHVRRFEAAPRAVRLAQERKLAAILRASQDTVYGREYGFARLRGIADFQARVPIGDYAHFEPYVQRAM